jgi:hypothetical protein
MQIRAILIVFITLGVMAGSTAMAPAWAQIFNPYKSNKNETGKVENKEAPTLYVKPKNLKATPKADPQKQAMNKSTTDLLLKNKALQAYVNDKIDFYDDWNASGKKPQTAEEINAYAKASRAKSQALMYARREQLAKHLQENAAKRAAEVEQKPKVQNASTKGTSLKIKEVMQKLKGQAPVKTSAKATVQEPIKPKSKALYVKPSLTQEPEKVFKPYL